MSTDVDVPLEGLTLPGTLTLPADACPVIIFAHGTGSSRHSPRNRYVANLLNAAGLGTLLFDLLTSVEERDRRNVFDVNLLAERLLGAMRWVHHQTPEARTGYFGASTGAAAALWAAAIEPEAVGAVVSRGGRPDLAGANLADVRAPTRLIVGGHDHVVLDLNREAQRKLRCENDLIVVPGATHLFEEAGTLETAAVAARDWFARHLQGDA